ncbi:hypothetical protein R3P38DRAFT_3356830 [Favolaschia claudopus]|uniref:Uncharacterized protein n=1 Tax=Favolaschia claudopus TaxID=2862362 RepID=A0AAW0BAF0_9AGAR
MSLLIDGTATYNIARSQGPTTLVSSSFVRTYFPTRRHQANSLGSFAFTLNTGDRGPLTVVLSCRILASLEFDVVLALDWKSHLRDLLLHLRHPVPAVFDPWSMISGFVASADAGISRVSLDPSVSLESSQSSGVESVLRIGDAAIPSAGGAVVSPSAGGAVVYPSAGGAVVYPVVYSSAGGADDLRTGGAAALCNLSVCSSEHSPPSSSCVSVPRNYDPTIYMSLPLNASSSSDVNLSNAMSTLAAVFGINNGSHFDAETLERMRHYMESQARTVH